MCKLKIKQLLLVREGSDERGLSLHTLKKHNVSNENIVDFDVSGAIEYLHGNAQNGLAGTALLPSLIVTDVANNAVVLDFVLKVKSHATTELIPVVTFVDEDSDSVQSALYNVGANSVIVKPTDPDQLSDVILNAMMYWTLLNHNPA